MSAHAYFDGLVARPDHWKSWTLRDDAQLAALRAAPGQPPAVTYDPLVDAAKVPIPTSYVAPDGTTKTTNSLRNQVRLPLGTADGHVYFFVWDVRWSETYVGLGRLNHKAFQFTSGTRDGNGLWLEVQTSYAITTRCTDADFIGSQQWRTYNQANTTPDWSASGGNQVGPGTQTAPMGPLTPFCLRPSVWTRFFLRLEQRASDFDRVDAWAADEVTDPVPVMTGLLVSVRPDGGAPNSVTEFWLEFNSSTDDLLGRAWDLIAHVRNVVSLIDPVDVQSLLIRPLADAPPAPVLRAPYDVQVA